MKSLKNGSWKKKKSVGNIQISFFYFDPFTFSPKLIKSEVQQLTNSNENDFYSTKKASLILYQ